MIKYDDMKKLVILLLAILFTVPVMADGEKKQFDKVVIALVDGRVFDIEIDADSYIYSYTTEKDGQVMQIIEFQHVKPGKGAAFVRTKIICSNAMR